MEIPCPACKKLTTAELCERCGADLSILRTIRRIAGRELTLGAEDLRKGKGKEALRHAECSWRLRKTRGAARLALMACLSLKDFQPARVWYARSCPPGRTKPSY